MTESAHYNRAVCMREQCVATCRGSDITFGGFCMQILPSCCASLMPVHCGAGLVKLKRSASPAGTPRYCAEK